jgi:hypothetical protein
MEISQTIIERFAAFVRERSHDEATRGSFGVDDMLEAIGEKKNKKAWEFAPEREGVCDFYELFGTLPEPFSVEEHGYDDFYAIDESFAFPDEE